MDWLVHIVETRTGKVVLNELPVLASPEFSRQINDDGSIRIQIAVGDRGVPPVSRLRQLVAAWRFSLAVSYGPSIPGSPVAAFGPIMAHQFDHVSGTLTVGAGSIWALLARRLLIDPTESVTSPLSMSETMDAQYANMTLSAIARNLVNDTLSRGTGYELPIDLPSTVTGVAERNYPIYDLATVGQRLKDLTQVEDGPDVDWNPYFSASNTLRVAMRIGTPELAQIGQDLIWDDRSSITSINVDSNSSTMTTDVYTRGNATERASQVAWSGDHTLVGTGWPVLESVDTSHQSVELFYTLQGHANEWIRFYRQPVETWEAEVATDTTPKFGTYSPGDTAKLNVQNHPWIPRGMHEPRILGWSNAGPRRLSLTLESFQGLT